MPGDELGVGTVDEVHYERAVIQAALLDDSALELAASSLEPRHFWFQCNRDAWRRILEARERGEKHDAASLYVAMNQDHDPTQVTALVGFDDVNAHARGERAQPEFVRAVLRNFSIHERSKLSDDMASQNGHRPTADEIVERMREIEACEAGVRSRREIRYVDMPRLAREGIPSVEWLIPGWLTTGENAVICGPSGTGKSTIVSQLAIAIADVHGSSDWCGLVPARRGHVLYIDQEQSESEVADILLRLNAERVSDHLHVAVQQNLNLSDQLFRLEQEMAIWKPLLVVLDSMMACFGVDSLSDIGEAMPIYGHLHRLRELYGCTFLMISHPRKAVADQRGKRQKLTMDDTFGSIAHQAQVGTAWLVQSNPKDIGDHVTLEQGKRRRVSKLLAMHVNYHSPGESMPITLTGTSTVGHLEQGTKSSLRGEATRNRIRAALTAAWQSPKEIGVSLAASGESVSPATLRRHLDALLEAGETEHQGDTTTSSYRSLRSLRSSAQMSEDNANIDNTIW